MESIFSHNGKLNLRDWATAQKLPQKNSLLKNLTAAPSNYTPLSTSGLFVMINLINLSYARNLVCKCYRKKKKSKFYILWGTEEKTNYSSLNFIKNFNNSCYIVIHWQDIICRSSYVWGKGHYNLHDVNLKAVLRVSLSINPI